MLATNSVQQNIIGQPKYRYNGPKSVLTGATTSSSSTDISSGHRLSNMTQNDPGFFQSAKRAAVREKMYGEHGLMRQPGVVPTQDPPTLDLPGPSQHVVTPPSRPAEDSNPETATGSTTHVAEPKVQSRSETFIGTASDSKQTATSVAQPDGQATQAPQLSASNQPTAPSSKKLQAPIVNPQVPTIMPIGHSGGSGGGGTFGGGGAGVPGDHTVINQDFSTSVTQRGGGSSYHFGRPGRNVANSIMNTGIAASQLGVGLTTVIGHRSLNTSLYVPANCERVQLPRDDDSIVMTGKNPNYFETDLDLPEVAGEVQPAPYFYPDFANIQFDGTSHRRHLHLIDEMPIANFDSWTYSFIPPSDSQYVITDVTRHVYIRSNVNPCDQIFCKFYQDNSIRTQQFDLVRFFYEQTFFLTNGGIVFQLKDVTDLLQPTTSAITYTFSINKIWSDFLQMRSNVWIKIYYFEQPTSITMAPNVASDFADFEIPQPPPPDPALAQTSFHLVKRKENPLVSMLVRNKQTVSEEGGSVDHERVVTDPHAFILSWPKMYTATKTISELNSLSVYIPIVPYLLFAHSDYVRHHFLYYDGLAYIQLQLLLPASCYGSVQVFGYGKWQKVFNVKAEVGQPWLCSLAVPVRGQVTGRTKFLQKVTDQLNAYQINFRLSLGIDIQKADEDYSRNVHLRLFVGALHPKLWGVTSTNAIPYLLPTGTGKVGAPQQGLTVMPYAFPIGDPKEFEFAFDTAFVPDYRLFCDVPPAATEDIMNYECMLFHGQSSASLDDEFLCGISPFHMAGIYQDDAGALYGSSTPIAYWGAIFCEWRGHFDVKVSYASSADSSGTVVVGLVDEEVNWGFAVQTMAYVPTATMDLSTTRLAKITTRNFKRTPFYYGATEPAVYKVEKRWDHDCIVLQNSPRDNTTCCCVSILGPDDHGDNRVFLTCTATPCSDLEFKNYRGVIAWADDEELMTTTLTTTKVGNCACFRTLATFISEFRQNRPRTIISPFMDLQITRGPPSERIHFMETPVLSRHAPLVDDMCVATPSSSRRNSSSSYIIELDEKDGDN